MPRRPFDKKDHLLISTLGLEFAVAIACGAAGGYYADVHWGTKPWLMVAGSLLGFCLGLYILIQTAVQLSKADQQKKK